MTESVWIGVDVGTSGARAAAYTRSGGRKAIAETCYALSTPQPGWVEQDPFEILQGVKEVVRRATDKLRTQRIDIRGIALSTVMHSFIPLGKDHEPLAPMMTWADTRAAEVVREIKADDDLAGRLYRKTGCPLHACYPLAKIRWLRQRRLDIFARMAYVGSIKDFLMFHLTGEWILDQSVASTSGMFDDMLLDWDDEAMEVAGISRWQLPVVVPAASRASMLPAVAGALSLPDCLPVLAGASDGVLVHVGLGALQEGQATATIGTSGAVRCLSTVPRVDARRRTWCYYLADGLWVAGGAVNNGGVILQWLRDEILEYRQEEVERLGVSAYELMMAQAEKSPAGAGGLLLLPYFSGERAPYWNEDLRGMFFGMSLRTKRSDMIRATMEAICFSLRTGYDALGEFSDIKNIHVSGSFAKAPLWVQILSDVLERDLIVPEVDSGVAYGAAVLGYLSDGEVSSLSELVTTAGEGQIYHPRSETSDTYRELYAIFGNLVAKLADDFHRITAFQSGVGETCEREG